jgi:RbsD/FucU transport protein family protein
MAKDVNRMRRSCLLLLAAATLFNPAFLSAQTSAQSDWKAKVSQSIPLLGHRNWILIVDSAYPLQSSPGVETIETNASHLDVLRYVLGAVNNSIHVRPLIYMDSELPFVSDEDAPGASAYRAQIQQMFSDYTIESLLHERVINRIDETSKQFHVLVLKTTMTVPYSSVFIRLDCKYWSADAEKRLRARMH